MPYGSAVSQYPNGKLFCTVWVFLMLMLTEVNFGPLPDAVESRTAVTPLHIVTKCEHMLADLANRHVVRAGWLGINQPLNFA